MSLVNKLSYKRQKKRRIEKLWRRSLAWLLAVCICLGNVNVAAFAAETSGIGTMGATPSNAVKDGSTATPSNADGSASEIWLPDGTMTGEELLAEAERAVTNEFRFDFNNLMKMIDIEDSEEEVDGTTVSNTERYEKLFKGYENFTLFYDNGKSGRIGDDEQAYAYIVIRVPKETYHSYLSGDNSNRIATASNADATEGGYKLSGDEDIVFLYVNASEQDVSFYLNLENVEAGEVTVPNADAIWEEPEKTEVSLPAEGGINTSGAETIDPAAPSESGGNKVEIDPAAPAPDRNEAAGDGGGNSGAQEDGSTQESENANTDSSQPSEIGTEDNQTNHTDITGSENGTETSENETSADNEDISGTVETSESKETAGTTETSESKETAGSTETSGDKGEAANTETKGNEEAAAFSETAGSDSISVDTGKSDENTEAPVESEVTLSSSRHNVFTLMEPYTDEEEMDSSDDEMTFEEWQAMVGDDEEEYEYDDRKEAVYDEEEGVIYLNLNVLPATVAEVKKEAPKRNLFARLFFAAPETLERAALQAGVANVMSLVPKIKGAHKQIEHLGGDDYRLHLDIAGGGTPLDILLVIDTSGSMEKDLNGKTASKGNTRLDKVKNILLGYTKGNEEIQGFVNSILIKNRDSRFGVVTFDSYGKQILDWTSEVSSIEDAVKGLTPNGGTNCEDGLWKASEMLKDVEPGHIPYMIFLSDGQPTYYMSPGTDRWGKWITDTFEGKATSTYRRGEGYSNEDYTEQTNKAITCTNGFRQQNSGLTSYAVNVGGAASDSVLKTITNDQSKVIAATDDSKLTSAFATILDSLKMKNVKIEDTLSEYVDLPGGSLANANVTVKAGDKELSKEDYELSYDPSLKKVTLDLSKATTDGILDLNKVYSLAFNIKVNSYAKSQYKAQNGYPDRIIGDPDTDYMDGTTSAGKPGFYSNREAKAIWAGSTTGFTYPKPVVQVPYEPEHRKYIKDNGDGTYDLTLDVQSMQASSESTVTTKIPADVVFVMDRSASMSYKINTDYKPGYNEKSRAAIVNSALEVSLKELDSDKYDIQFAGYKFAGRTYSYNYPYGYSYDTQKITFGKNATWTGKLNGQNPFAISPSTSMNGTAPAYALEMAGELLREGSTEEHRSDANLQRYIIFVTDGKPESNSNDIDAEEASYDAAATIGEGLNNVRFFAIKVSKNVPDEYMNALVQKLPENVTKKVWPGTTEDEIITAFNEIKKDIIDSTTSKTYGVTNIVITDELSEYADFAVTDESDVVITKNGQRMDDVEYRAAIKSVVKTQRTKGENPQITVTFHSDYELTAGAKYGVTFKVKPSQAAYDAYKINSGYGGMIGDPDTDALGNDTSSRKPGFRTNTSAKLQYKWGDYSGSVEYDHPVLQVKRGKVRIQKIVDNHDVALNEEDQFLIHLRNETGVYASVVLGPGEVSPYIYTEGLLTLSVSESVPMEYRQADQFIKVRKNGETSVPITGNEVTIGPGDDLVIEVHNVFGHKPYFHGEDLIINRTTGNPEIPFTNATENSGNYLLEQVAAAVDPGKRGIEFRELGEDDALV